MTLRTRILVILTLVVVGFVMGDALVQRALVLDRFEGLERDFAELRMRQVHDTLDRRREGLAAQGRRIGIRLTNEPPAETTLSNEHGVDQLDLFFLVTERGLVKAHSVLHPETRERIRLREFPEEALSPGHDLLVAGSEGGLLETELGPLLVGVAEIAPPAPGAPSMRALSGRLVTPEFLAELGSGLAVELHTVDEIELLDNQMRQILNGGEPRVDTVSEDTLVVQDLLPDVRGLPSLLLTVKVPRELARLARDSASDSILSGASAALLILLTLVFLLQHIVVRPLRVLTDHAIRIGATNDTTMRLNSPRTDELGVLANELDRMVAELQRSRDEAQELARLAGASEIATGVLHNVGNVLNSVNVNVRLASRRVRRMPVDDIGRLADVLEDNLDDLSTFVREDPRGRHLLPFLRETHRALKRERDSTLNDLQETIGGVEHIESLVQAQSTYTGRGSALTWVRLDELVEQAITLATQARPESERVAIARSFGRARSVELERHKVLEILVNLLVNAFDALAESDVALPRVQVRVEEIENGFAIEVADNGVGIARERLEEIFAAGVSTKGEHRGHGLHTSALAATELGGRLEACSEGLGHGASFRLTLHFASTDTSSRAA